MFKSEAQKVSGDNYYLFFCSLIQNTRNMKTLICTLVTSYGSTFKKKTQLFFSFSTGIPVYSTQSVYGLWTCGLSAESAES